MEENNIVKKEDNGKKKKIIIAAVIAVIIIGVAAAVYFAVNKDDNGYKDVPVAQTVTNENGETVTDANGNAVTENAAAQGSKPQTTNNNAGGGNNQQQNNDNNNQGGGSASGSDAEKDKKPDDKPVDTKPKNRKIKITAELPQGYSADDVMEIWVNGEKDSEFTVRDYLDGKIKVVVTTENKYKGDAEVVALLRNYKTQTQPVTVADNAEEINIIFPLNKVESFEGEDD